MNSNRRRNIAALVVTLFGCGAMIGDLAGSMVLKGLAAACAFAPFPKVFCDNEGLEGFASNISIRAEVNGIERDIVITPELYGRLRGPYNRRNVYGAVFSFAPKLPPELWESVYEHGLGVDGSLRKEFGIEPDATNVRVDIGTKTRGRQDRWIVRPCE